MSTDESNPPNGTDEPRGADLLTIGLLVFFIALLATVAALLVLPLIFG